MNELFLDQAAVGKLAQELNALLADYAIMYQNLRAYHWKVKGKDFSRYHAYFEALYTEMSEAMDALAERILILGEDPADSYSEYLRLSQFSEVTSIPSGEEILKNIHDAYQKLIQKERSLLTRASDMEDHGTADLLTGQLSAREKTLWMLRASLS
jgi:starvation-inducible DNA-binding protein